MSRCKLAVGALSLFAFVSVLGLSVATNNAPANEATEMLKKMAALEKRVADLEKRLARQEQTPPAPNSVYQAGGVATPPSPNVPAGSVPRSINGTQFYIVPLSKQVSR